MADEAFYRAIAARRVLSVTRRHSIILRRTLEHKIADAGPYDQRVNPQHITYALKELVKAGNVAQRDVDGAQWSFLPDAEPSTLEARLSEQLAVHRQTLANGLPGRVGQALEIAIARGLEAVPDLDMMGGFPNLDEHPDNLLYIKDGPPSRFSGRQLPNGQKLDFLVRARSTDVWGGIEAKNVRPWIYVDSTEFRDLVSKCLLLDVVPILVARRIHFNAGTTLRRCGGITWETLRQRYPVAAADIAERARNKWLLGYSDITLGNHCDTPLARFIDKLPALLPEAHVRFNHYKDLLHASTRARSMPPSSSLCPEHGKWTSPSSHPPPFYTPYTPCPTHGAPMHTSRHLHHRRAAAFDRLDMILAELDALTDRRTKLPPRLAGPARRTIAETRALLGLPPKPLPRALHPAQLLVETLQLMHTPTARKAPPAGAFGAIAGQTYPRAPRLA